MRSYLGRCIWSRRGIRWAGGGTALKGDVSTWLWNKNRPNQFSTGNCGKRYMYATTREEKEIMIPNHGLFPLFLDTDGLSRIQADKEIRRLTQARY